MPSNIGSPVSGISATRERCMTVPITPSTSQAQPTSPSSSRPIASVQSPLVRRGAPVGVGGAATPSIAPRGEGLAAAGRLELAGDLGLLQVQGGEGEEGSLHHRPAEREAHRHANAHTHGRLHRLSDSWCVHRARHGVGHHRPHVVLDVNAEGGLQDSPDERDPRKEGARIAGRAGPTASPEGRGREWPVT